jgi:hypothetical protein
MFRLDNFLLAIRHALILTPAHIHGSQLLGCRGHVEGPKNSEKFLIELRVPGLLVIAR